MNVKIEVIPYDQQRYPTVGDWYFQKNNLVIRVSDLGNIKYEMLVALHELVEVLLCMHDGVSQHEVDTFDKKFEKERKPGDDSEPGDHPKAPYQKQHSIATGVERIMSACLGVKWDEYAESICKLP